MQSYESWDYLPNDVIRYLFQNYLELDSWVACLFIKKLHQFAKECISSDLKENQIPQQNDKAWNKIFAPIPPFSLPHWHPFSLIANKRNLQKSLSSYYFRVMFHATKHGESNLLFWLMDYLKYREIYALSMGIGAHGQCKLLSLIETERKHVFARIDMCELVTMATENSCVELFHSYLDTEHEISRVCYIRPFETLHLRFSYHAALFSDWKTFEYVTRMFLDPVQRSVPAEIMAVAAARLGILDMIEKFHVSQNELTSMQLRSVYGTALFYKKEDVLELLLRADLPRRLSNVTDVCCVLRILLRYKRDDIIMHMLDSNVLPDRFLKDPLVVSTLCTEADEAIIQQLLQRGLEFTFPCIAALIGQKSDYNRFLRIAKAMPKEKHRGRILELLISVPEWFIDYYDTVCVPGTYHDSIRHFIQSQLFDDSKLDSSPRVIRWILAHRGAFYHGALSLGDIIDVLARAILNYRHEVIEIILREHPDSFEEKHIGMLMRLMRDCTRDVNHVISVISAIVRAFQNTVHETKLHDIAKALIDMLTENGELATIPVYLHRLPITFREYIMRYVSRIVH